MELKKNRCAISGHAMAYIIQGVEPIRLDSLVVIVKDVEKYNGYMEDYYKAILMHSDGKYVKPEMLWYFNKISDTTIIARSAESDIIHLKNMRVHEGEDLVDMLLSEDGEVRILAFDMVTNKV